MNAPSTSAGDLAPDFAQLRAAAAPAHVVMPENASRAKMAAVRADSGRIILDPDRSPWHSAPEGSTGAGNP